MNCSNGAVTLDATSAVTVSAALAGAGSANAVSPIASAAVAAAIGASASRAVLRAHIGLMTKNARNAATKLRPAAISKIGNQLPVASLRTLAKGTSKAAVPFEV